MPVNMAYFGGGSDLIEPTRTLTRQSVASCGSPVLGARRPPDFARGVDVHRCDADSDQQVGPSRMCMGRDQPGRDDREARYRIVAS